MAKDITVIFDPNKTIYATVQDSDQRYLNGDSFVVRNDDNWTDYVHSVPATTNDPSVYAFDFPSIGAGSYLVRIWDQVSPTPLATDPFLIAGTMNWDGTKEVPGYQVGVGIYILTVIVTNEDTSLPIPDVVVRIAKDEAFFEWRTNVEGKVVFAVMPGTWSISYYKFGYKGGTAPQIVNADTVSSFTMKQQFVDAPDDISKCNCWQTARGPTGDIAPGAKFEFNLVTLPTADTDSYSTKNFVVSANEQGIVEVALPRTAVYEYRYGRRGDFIRFSVPDAPTFRMPETNSNEN